MSHAGALRTSVVIGAFTLAMVGCVSRKAGPPATVAPAEPELAVAAYTASACRQGSRVYRLDEAGSRVRVLVGKAGALSGAGHVHVISVTDIRGFAELGGAGGRADLVFALADMRVDVPSVRKAMGGAYAEVMLTPDQRAGTRENMLKSLHAATWPRVHLAIQRRSATADALAPAPARVRLWLHGVAGEYKVPVRLHADDAMLSVDGSLEVRQSAFGIQPFSIMMGALRVEDALQVRYHLEFQRWHLTGSQSCAA